MKAETAFNVIESLSQEEKKRLFKMLNIEQKEEKTKSNKSLVPDAQIREMIVSQFKRFSKNFKQNNNL